MPRKRSDLGTGVGEPSAGARRRHYTPEERRRAVEAYRASGLTQADFARTYGLSPFTLNTWKQAYEKRGPKAFERLSEGPPRRRGKAPMHPAKKAAILEVSRGFPGFGLRKVRDFLARFSGLSVSASSVRRTQRAAGIPPVARPRRRRRTTPEPERFQRSRPGELWQSDITYLRAPWSRSPLYLVAFLDDFSRYVVSAQVHTHQRQDIVIEAYTEGALRFGRPKEVLTDQGRQYYAWRGKSDFQKLLKKEGVEHVVARAHHPQTVGKCERFWETLKAEFWDRAKVRDLEDARARLKHFLAHYNHFRPHQGLDGLTPADRFFGAESSVRHALEGAMARNELLLSIGEAPRKPVFLVGQIGDQTVSLHGEKGRVVVQTPDGVVRELSTEELGVESNTKEVGRGRDERDGRGGGGDRAANAAGVQAHEDRRAHPDAGGRAGSLEGGERGGAGAGAPPGGRAAAGVAGQDQPGGGGEGAGAAPASVLAAVAAGGGGDGGGMPSAAAVEPRTAEDGPSGAGAGGGRGAASQEDPGARGGALGGEEADRDPEAAARAPRERERSGDGTCGDPFDGEGDGRRGR
jgi:transposase InsO family protein